MGESAWVSFTLPVSFDGYELWKTDGNTFEEIKNIENPTGPGLGSEVKELTTYSGKIYFSAIDDINGEELWVTDGTEVGTQMLKDINPTGDSYPDFFAEYNGTLYFSARDGSNGYELWTTDGTAAGTQMFKDINPGSGAGFFIDPAFTEYNGKLYFIAEDGSNGEELWVTDGTAAGTEKIQPATTGAFPLSYNPYLTEFDGALYFSADYDSHGNELWKLTAPNLSVDDLTLEEVKIYPNPVNDLLQIQSDQEIVGIALYSLTGQKLQTWENQDDINLSSYASGIYFVKVETSVGIKTTKIIKE